MKVTAAPGLKCPMENNPKKYIAANAAAEVPDTAYYRRLVADGSLVQVVSAQARKKEGN